MHELAPRTLQRRREIAKLRTISRTRVGILVESPIDRCSTAFRACENQG